MRLVPETGSAPAPSAGRLRARATKRGKLRPLNSIDPTGTSCVTLPHSAKTCQVDSIKNKDGTVTARKDFNKTQAKAVAKFERKYTQSVRRLEKTASQGRAAEIKGPNGQTTKVDAGRVASELSSTEVTVDMNYDKYMSASPGRFTVGPDGLGEPTGGAGMSGMSRDAMYGVAIVHEGLHGAYYWAANMWKGVPTPEFNHDHQEPFNDAARELLR